MRRLDVDEMLSSMTSRQVAGWMDYYDVEPWGEGPAERRAANIACAIVSGNGVRCKPEDFMPMAWRTRVQQSWRAMKSAILDRFGIKR
jgi:hypothetical protein